MWHHQGTTSSKKTVINQNKFCVKTSLCLLCRRDVGWGWGVSNSYYKDLLELSSWHFRPPFVPKRRIKRWREVQIWTWRVDVCQLMEVYNTWGFFWCSSLTVQQWQTWTVQQWVLLSRQENKGMEKCTLPRFFVYFTQNGTFADQYLLIWTALGRTLNETCQHSLFIACQLKIYWHYIGACVVFSVFCIVFYCWF